MLDGLGESGDAALLQFNRTEQAQLTDEQIETEQRNALEAMALCQAFEQHLKRLGRLAEVDQRRALMLIEQLDKTFAAWRSNFS